MIVITNETRSAFQSSLPKELILDFPIGRTLTNEDIFQESMELEQSICDESNLAFGMVYSTCLTVRIFDDGLSYTGLTVNPTLSVEVENGTTLTMPIGQYKVVSDNLTADKIYRDLKCYDALADVLSFDYSAWHNSQPAAFTLKSYRDAFFSHIGIVQESVTLANDSVTLRKFSAEKLSGAQIIGAILQLTGCFGFIRFNGKFQYVSPSTTPQIDINDNQRRANGRDIRRQGSRLLR